MKIRWQNARQAIDVSASLGMLLVSILIGWVILRAPAQTRPATPDIRPPDSPVSIDGAPTLGNRSADVVIVEYSDFQCPYCGKFVRETMPQLRSEYIDTGLVRLAFRSFPLTNIHPRAFRAAESAECAARQGNFWQMHDRLFENGARLEETDLDAHAQAAGLNLTTFRKCLGGEAKPRVDEDVESGKLVGLKGTPTFLVGRVQADGKVRVERVLTGAVPIAEFAKVLAPLVRQVRGGR